jgi:hypothetical protein
MQLKALAAAIAIQVFVLAACSGQAGVVAVVNQSEFDYLVKVVTPTATTTRLVLAWADGDVLWRNTPTPGTQLVLIDPTSCSTVATVDVPAGSSWASILEGQHPHVTFSIAIKGDLTPNPSLLPADDRCG